MKRDNGRWCYAALVAGFLACAASPAAGQTAADVAAARDLFKEASALSQTNDWEGARKAYAKSLQLKRAAITLYSIGVAEKHTGHLLDALEHFRAFLAEPSSQATKPYEQPARDAIAELEKRVARIVLIIEPLEADPEVTIDGADVPKAALDHPRLIDPGAHEIVVHAKGYVPAKQSASTSEGQSTTVKIKLDPAPAEPVVAPPPATSSAAPVVMPHTDAPPAPNRTLPLALIGGGGALLVGGIVVGVLGVSQASSAPTKDGPQASSAKTKALVGDILGGAGIVAAGIGVVLLITSKPPKRDAAGSIGPWAAGSVGGMRVRF
jgi:hypothetical protein